MNMQVKKEMRVALETQMMMLQNWHSRTDDETLKKTLAQRIDSNMDAIRMIDMGVAIDTAAHICEDLIDLVHDLNEMPAVQKKLQNILNKIHNSNGK